MKRIVLSSAVLALAIGGMGVGSAAPAQYKVTGGGQVTEIAAEEEDGEPTLVKYTLAFNAQTETADSDAARGQLQFNAHDGVNKFHGEVTCLQVDPVPAEGAPRTARVGGEYTTKDGVRGTFRLLISDTDFGGPQNQNEAVSFTYGAGEGDANCDSSDEDETNMTFGNGNIVIHKDKDPKENGSGKGQGGGLL